MKTVTYAFFDLQNGSSISEILCMHISSSVRDPKLAELSYFQDFSKIKAKNRHRFDSKNAITN